jgi:hypothetical protein
MQLYDPMEPIRSPAEPLAMIAPPVRRKVRTVKRGSWTLVAKGPGERGLRFMFKAKTIGEAMKRGREICQRERLDFVHVFAGHMAALRYA